MLRMSLFAGAPAKMLVGNVLYLLTEPQPRDVKRDGFVVMSPAGSVHL